MIEILQPGLLTTIQDPGRRGYEVSGIPASGPFDPFLAQIASHLVGNQKVLPLLEFAMIGPHFRFHQDALFAIAAYASDYFLDGKQLPQFTAALARKDSVLEFRQMQSWFGYIAFAGGLESEKILGSASTYVSGQIGKRIQKGDLLDVQKIRSRKTGFRLDPKWLNIESELHLLRALHTQDFTEADKNQLENDTYKLLPQSNRMGIYLQGAGLKHSRVYRSSPALPGTVQILPSGQPLILGPEGPTTGGYPQVATVSRSSWTALAAAKPGGLVKLRWKDVNETRKLWDQRQELFKDRKAWLKI